MSDEPEKRVKLECGCIEETYEYTIITIWCDKHAKERFKQIQKESDSKGESLPSTYQ